MPFKVQSNYRQVIRNLRVADKAIKKNLRSANQASIVPIIAEARSIATSHGFRRVPGAIVPTQTTTYVGIKVKAKTSAAGVLHERNSRKGRWRHPVFGNRNVWVSQKAYPSVTPALKASGAKVTAEIKAAVSLAEKEAGFH